MWPAGYGLGSSDVEVDYIEIDNGLLYDIWCCKNHLKYTKLRQKYRKIYLEMIARTQLKAVFKFLNTIAESKSWRLNEILLRLSFSNSGFFFFKTAFGLLVFCLKQRWLFSLNGRLSLFSVKLCSVQKFWSDMIYLLFNIHGYVKCTLVTQCFCHQYCKWDKCKNVNCRVNMCRIELRP